MIDDQMQLEAEEPAHRCLAPRRQIAEHPMLADATVMADLQASGIHETDTATGAETAFEIDAQGNQSRRDPIDEALIADQTGEGIRPILSNVSLVIPFEGAIALVVKSNQQCQDLAQAQLSRAMAPFDATVEQLAIPLGLECSTEVIYVPKQSF